MANHKRPMQVKVTVPIADGMMEVLSLTSEARAPCSAAPQAKGHTTVNGCVFACPETLRNEKRLTACQKLQVIIAPSVASANWTDFSAKPGKILAIWKSLPAGCRWC